MMVFGVVRQVALMCLLFFAVTVQAENLEQAHNSDPWEGFNRKIFAFNEFIDRYFLKPVAKTYRFVTPDRLEGGVDNFFYNAVEIRTILNDLAQLKVKQAGQDTLRFVVNTTIGVGGFIDVGTRIGLDRHDEDFGQTLGYWGVSSGPFLMLPFLGPKTLRGSVGIYPDSQLTALRLIDHDRTKLEVTVLGAVAKRAELMKQEKHIIGDRYTFIREAYLQRRAYLVNDGFTDDVFGDDDFDEELDEDF